MVAVQYKMPALTANRAQQVVIVLNRPAGNQNEDVNSSAMDNAQSHFEKKQVPQWQEGKGILPQWVAPRNQPRTTKQTHSMISGNKNVRQRLRASCKKVDPDTKVGSQPLDKPRQESVLYVNNMVRSPVSNIRLGQNIRYIQEYFQCTQLM